MLEQKRVKPFQGTRSPLLHPRALLPLGKFLCPICNTSHLISRLGVSVIPLSLLNPTYHEDKHRSSLHSGTAESYCFSYNKHHTEDMDRVRNSLDTALRDAANEIAERMQAIETDIARIRVAREADVHERRKIRREVVTYYEGYVKDVNRHKTKLERKLSLHHENSANILIKEEVQLEQCRMDLRMLCAQIQKLLTLRNNMEVIKLMAPVTKKLKKISQEIAATGTAIINKLQFVPKSISNSDIPGFLSTFSVCPAKSHAIIDRPIYEKVICSIRLHLADENGMKLDVYHDISIQAVMTLYDQQAKYCKMVDVSVQNNESDGWNLVFNPQFSGIAHLSVTVDGGHIKNSPYVMHVRTLALDDSFVSQKENAKKSVKFSEFTL